MLRVLISIYGAYNGSSGPVRGYRFLNAGFLAGAAGDLLQLFEDGLSAIEPGEKFDDQAVYRDLFLAHHKDLGWIHSLSLCTLDALTIEAIPNGVCVTFSMGVWTPSSLHSLNHADGQQVRAQPWSATAQVDT